MRHLRMPAGAAAVTAVVAVLAAGCGGTSSGPSGGSAPASPSSAATLAGNVRSAVANASSFHVAGTLTHGGQEARLNLSITRAGGAAGTVGLGSASFYLLTTGGKTYIKINPAFLKAIGQPAAACSTFCNKYLLASPSQAQSLSGNLGWSSLVGTSFTSELPKATLHGSATVNGQQAWVLRLRDGATLQVAARGPAYPLRAAKSSATGGGQTPAAGTGQLNFTQWNHAAIPQPPPPGQVVDLSKLGA